MVLPCLAIVLMLAGIALACGDDHTHTHTHVQKREFPSAPLTPPSRPLQWGSLNVIHTTDSHGWLLGHQHASFPEPNYSGDFGDFASFVAHMKELALEKDVDLLLIDSGDLHDGTGLSDGFPVGGVDAHASNGFFKQLPYDLLTIGNHELYIYNNTLDMHENFAPHFPGRYLSSNVNITINNASVPVGSRFAKFKTRKGRSVTSLGVLYDFTDNDAGTTVQFVADMVKEAWFAEAIKEKPDLFLLAGHMPVARDNWPLVYDAIRAVHPLTPILILGGHSHVRNCLQFDGRSIALESGRYMETVGWLSADLPPPNTAETSQNITFSRRYLDPNRVTYEFHTGKGNFSFDTAWGKGITKGLEDLSKAFDLTFEYGVAPHDFTLSRSPFPSNDSILSLVATALPIGLAVNNTRASIPNIMITNSGELRFDIFAGTFTKNDQLTASPFMDSFLFIPNVTAGVAKGVVEGLNGGGLDAVGRRAEDVQAERWARGYVEARYREWLKEMHERDSPTRRDVAENLTLGYVTTDTCPGGVGDDTPHVALPFFSSPDYIASAAPDVSDDTPIDLVFIDFIQSDVLGVLNSLQSETVYTGDDAALYTDILMSQVLGVYAQQVWN
ncbi:Metallo-dependent phosphatase-like protein [Roridomyces roridus]|uniref:Metallo-dependent phosphatase-like protein n=1 Tax=Roridomyces roridus TaxID=1738132 RepID=A0AAD7FNV6_9AGAR|nr:Metallo-dependent phosphatase-like protein [Roridomyces roridus]